eukprot:1453856-Rhodomonas_salina.1
MRIQPRCTRIQPRCTRVSRACTHTHARTGPTSCSLCTRCLCAYAHTAHAFPGRRHPLVPVLAKARALLLDFVHKRLAAYPASVPASAHRVRRTIPHPRPSTPHPGSATRAVSTTTPYRNGYAATRGGGTCYGVEAYRPSTEAHMPYSIAVLRRYGPIVQPPSELIT